MRDTFYCWLYLSLMLAMFLGAALARAGLGETNWIEIITDVVLGALAVYSTVDHYRKK